MSQEATPEHVIEMVSDTICPWCCVGLTRLKGALKELPSGLGSFVVKHLPFQLNPGMPAEGMDRMAYRSGKFGSWERSLALDGQVEDAGREEGLMLNHQRIERTPNTLASHVLIHLAGEEGVQEEVAEAVFRGYFAEGRDIGSPDTLAELGKAAGMKRDDLADAVQDPELRALVADAALRESDGGVSGVPTFRLNGVTLFSGAQPRAVMRAAIERALEDLGAGGHVR